MSNVCQELITRMSLRPAWLRGRLIEVSVRIVCCLLIAAAVSLPGDALAKDGERLVYRLSFTDYEEGPIEDWLMIKGFDFQQDAKRRRRIDFDIGPDGLIMETKRRSFGIMFNESVNAPEFTAIEIDWGVNVFPEGASYEGDKMSDALMVVAFMGDERVSSGSMFIPDSPYFVGLFLCEGVDKVNHPYVGKYFQKGGRYICADKPEAGQMVTSRFDLLEGYRTFFDKERDDDPAISGIALSVDTQKAKRPGAAEAFIREIRLYR